MMFNFSVLLDWSSPIQLGELLFILFSGGVSFFFLKFVIDWIFSLISNLTRR